MVTIHPLNAAYPHDYDSHLAIVPFPDGSGGQGTCPNHADNPHHTTITAAGWVYSHTTPVNHVGGRIAHHTYKFPGADWNVSVICRPGFQVTSSRGGSGREMVLFGASVGRYLASKAKQLRKEIAAGRPCPYAFQG